MPDVQDDLVSTKNKSEDAKAFIDGAAKLGLLYGGAMHKHLPMLTVHDEVVYSVDMESTELKTLAGAAMLADQAEAKLKPYQDEAIKKLKDMAGKYTITIAPPPKNLDITDWAFYPSMMSADPFFQFKQRKTWGQLQREEIEKNARQAILSHMKGAADPVPIPKSAVAHYNPNTYHKPRYTKPDLSVEALTGVLTRFADKEVTRMAEQKDNSIKEATHYMQRQLEREKDRNRSLRDRLAASERETDNIAAELKRLQERDASIARIMSTEGRKFRHDEDE
jgi:hypothetical protein